METILELEVTEIKKDHLLRVINNNFQVERKKFKYTVDNLLTYSVTVHPHFTIWCCAAVMCGFEACRENANDEMFGAGNEGPHSRLVVRAFKQFGECELKHYTRCQDSINKIYHYVNKDRINVLFAFLCCCELASFFFEDLTVAWKSLGIKDMEYIDVHTEADNLEDGHGIKMIDYLVENLNTITVSEFNTGMKLFLNFFSDIFTN